jgi:hypothetical protein
VSLRKPKHAGASRCANAHEAILRPDLEDVPHLTGYVGECPMCGYIGKLREPEARRLYPHLAYRKAAL